MSSNRAGVFCVVLSLFLAQAALAGERRQLATPWPRVRPCAHPKILWVEPASDLRWSSADRRQSVRYRAAQVRVPNVARLGPRFPAGQLTRVQARLDPEQGLQIRLECGEDVDAQIDWIWGKKADLWLSASYELPRDVPLPSRAHHWFVEHFAELSGQSSAAAAAKLSRVLVQDLRESIAIACVGGRCSELIATIDAAAEGFLSSAVRCESDADGKVQWRCGEQRVEMDCEESETDTSCSLFFVLPGPVGRVFFILRDSAPVAGDSTETSITLTLLDSEGDIRLTDHHLSPQSPAGLEINNRLLGIE